MVRTEVPMPPSTSGHTITTVSSSTSMPVTVQSKMTPEQFCYWLQGLLELSPDLKKLNAKQVEMIREHLKYVFEGKQVQILQQAIPGFTLKDVQVPGTQLQPPYPHQSFIEMPNPLMEPGKVQEFITVC